ncbi:glycerol kinase GlpK [Afifella sp. IM 167]|uniref:glycerol kinase GlpK n=1 Tax=Afifella sp. IM 167 TaxID=2033586 RepID=UPI001CD0060F|nr:glycerol kinase GlpK [Afifella sp. IM 167]MBZ8134311.1 glycerol kinase [Afifella sp. IM 167]
MSGFVLAIDQGTTSTRAIVFDAGQRVVGVGQLEFPQHFPHSGWVEHDPDDLWRTTVAVVRRALAEAKISARDLAGLGITNQRETALVWDRNTGEAIHNAIVWQDRRTARLCERLIAEGNAPMVAEKTGLLIDSYFSGTKVAWMLENVDGAKARAEAGDLVFGTVDTWLIWKLTGGRRHVTDATNASRTLMFDIRAHDWDDELLKMLGVPRSMLPEVLDSAADFGTTDAEIFGSPVPILGVAGDQQAATVGQACFTPGMVKSTYGTGCFAVLNTGEEFVASGNRLLTTIAYRLDGKTTYALEGSIFVAGAAVQWLRDELKLIERAEESGQLASHADEEQEVYLVPAFTGLGAPWWDADARGAIFGLSRATGREEIAMAALESVCLQTLDLVEAMQRDWTSSEETVLRVDGGMVASDWTMQRLADLLDAPVDRPVVLETTALGAAWLAGRQAGVWPGEAEFAESWRRDRRFEPSFDEKRRERKIAGWRDAVGRTLSRQA